MAGSTAPSSANTLTPAQQKISQSLSGIYQGQVGQGVPSYPGQQVAPLNQGYSQVQSLADTTASNQYPSGTSGALNQALSGQPAFNLDPSTTANWYQNAVVAPAQQNFNQSVAPQINSGFAGTGGVFSSMRGNAMQRALSTMQTGTEAQLAQGQFSNQALQAQLAQSAANNQLQGVGLAQQQYQQQGMMPYEQASAISSALAPMQQNAQAQDTADFQNWLYSQPYNSPWLSMAQQYMNAPIQALYQRPVNPAMQAGVGIIGDIIGSAGGVVSGAAKG